MIIHALKFKQDDGERLHFLDKRLQALHCMDAHLSRSLSQVLHRILSSRKILDTKFPVSVVTEISGQKSISALLSEAGDSLESSVPSLPLANDPPEIIGADLHLLSFEEMLSEATDCNRIALEMAAIVDTGNAHHGLIAAIARLDSFSENIGRSRDGDTAINRERAHLEALKEERAALMPALEQAKGFSAPLHQYRTEAEQCRIHHAAIEKKWCASVVCHVVQLQKELRAAEQQLAKKSEEPSLDSEQLAAIQRAATLVETARLQLDCTQEEVRTIQQELEELQGIEDPDIKTETGSTETLERLQQEIQSGQGRITEFNARLDEVTSQIAVLDGHITNAQTQLIELPDFSRIAPNPIDWLNQLARSFKTALNMRSGEEETRDTLRTELSNLRVDIAGDAAIFENNSNFSESLLVHQNKKKQWEVRSTQAEKQVRHNRSLRDELEEKIPGLFMLSLGCGLFLSLLLGAYVGLQKTPILYPCGFVLLSTLVFVMQLLVTRSRIRHITRKIAEDQAELDVMTDEEGQEVSLVDRLMTRADCRTARELEARYDHYSELRSRLNALKIKCVQQQGHLLESEERIPKLFERVRSTLEQVDEIPRNEDDVEGAVGRAISKYQVYRETKRRLADLRNQHQGLLSRKRFLEKELTIVREGMPEAEQKLRDIMIAQGFAAEAEYRDISNALAAYYRFLDTHEKDIGRHRTLIRARQSFDARLSEEESIVREHKQSFETLLKQAGFGSLEQAREAAAHKNSSHKIEEEKNDLERQCEVLLQGRPLEDWRKLAGGILADDDDSGVEYYARQLKSIEAESNEALKQYRTQHQEYQQVLAAHRSLNEIEEDTAAVKEHIDRLRNDIRAAAHATALIEEIFHTWRTHYGDALATRASEILETLGISALLYIELDPNAVPIIEIVTENESDTVPVPVINLAFHLAAAELLIDTDSPCPLIIDAALQGTPLPVPPQKLIDALEGCAENRQVLLVFDSEKIAEDARSKGIPILSF